MYQLQLASPSSSYSIDFQYSCLIILLLWEVFAATLADGLSHEFQWQHVSLNLQDSFQYSGRSQPIPPVHVTIIWCLFQVQLVPPSLSCSIVFFQFSSKVQLLILLFAFFSFTLCLVGTAKSRIGKAIFFVDYHRVLSSDPYKVIRLYLKTPKLFVHRIPQDEFRVVHMAFVRMINFKFVAQFPVDHLAHLVVSSLIFFLC